MQGDDAIPFEPTPDRLSEFQNAVMSADPVGALQAARKATELPLGDLPMAAIGFAMVLYAFAAVLKQIRPVAQPIADAVGDRMREAPVARPEARHQAAGDSRTP
jgi:hypothetical protein